MTQLVRAPGASTGSDGVPSLHSSRNDKCFGTQKRGIYFCWAPVWVNDIVYGSTDENFGRWFEVEMGKQFTISHFGPLACFLGIEFKAEKEDDLTLSYKHNLYISNLLTKFGMHNGKIASTPSPEKCALSKDDQSDDSSEDASNIAGCDFRVLAGSISYLAMTTRPHLAFAAHLLSRFFNKPSLVYCQAVKHVLQYPGCTEDVGITYWPNCEAHLPGHLDADCESCEDDRKSLTEYCLSYRSGGISWSVKKPACLINDRSRGSSTARSGQGSTSITRDPRLHWRDQTNNHS